MADLYTQSGVGKKPRTNPTRAKKPPDGAAAGSPERVGAAGGATGKRRNPLDFRGTFGERRVYPARIRAARPHPAGRGSYGLIIRTQSLPSLCQPFLTIGRRAASA